MDLTDHLIALGQAIKLHSSGGGRGEATEKMEGGGGREGAEPLNERVITTCACHSRRGRGRDTWQTVALLLLLSTPRSSSVLAAAASSHASLLHRRGGRPKRVTQERARAAAAMIGEIACNRPRPRPSGHSRVIFSRSAADFLDLGGRVSRSIRLEAEGGRKPGSLPCPEACY